MSVLEVFRKAPRDFFVLLVLTFFQSLVLFGVFGIIMWILTENCGFSDSVAGLLFGCFSSCTAVYGFFLGPVIDVMLIKKTLLFHLVCAFIGQVVMSASMLHPIAVCIALYLPMSMGFSVMHAVISIALQRYIPDSHRDFAYPLRYAVMNLGAFVAPFIVDTFRLKLPAYVFGTQIPRWSFFLACTALMEIPLFIMVFFGIRDIEVRDDWSIVPLKQQQEAMVPTDSTENLRGATEAPVDSSGTQAAPEFLVGSSKGPVIIDSSSAAAVLPAVAPMIAPALPVQNSGWRAVKEILLRSVMFRRFLLLCVILIGAHSVFVYDYSLYPVYMKRAPFPVLDPSAIPFMWFLSIDPLIVAVLALFVGALAQKHNVERYWTIVVGSAVGACAPFFMMTNHYWGVVMFVVVMAVGESLWSPLFDRYVCEFTEKGKEGIFFGLAGIITTVARLITNISSGLMLTRFCSAQGSCEDGKWIWFIAGWIAFSTPIFLLITMRWTRLKPSEKASYTRIRRREGDQEEDVVELDVTKDHFGDSGSITTDNEQERQEDDFL